MLEAPGKLGADVAVGECQPLGMPLLYGGPYAGYMATHEKNARQLPGRISGETVDEDGKLAYVLTLRAREQDIRRARANSNICTNQALTALAATVYTALVGPEGLREVAELSISKAHYLAERLKAGGPRGFVTRTRRSSGSSPSSCRTWRAARRGAFGERIWSVGSTWVTGRCSSP